MRPAKKKLWALVLAGLAGLLALGVWLGPRLAYTRFGYLALKPVPGGLTPQQEKETRQALPPGLRGRVVWSSSRSGNHEIYLLRLPELELYRLTNNDRVDFYPRFSPDGQSIVFARSQKPWVSERDYDQWDTYLLELNTNQERLLARDANFPQWVDARRVSFMRRAQVVVKDVASGQEHVVYDGEKSPVAGRIETPELLPRDPNLLAVTARGRLSGVLVADLNSGGQVFYGEGCEITWFPDGRQVLWMDNQGRGGSRVMASSYPEVRPRVLMDLPGPFSHEYFPRLSRDGRYLVWGASQGDHEHDIADYEIFLWALDQPPEKAVRLTYSPANDRWPDIHLD